MIYLDQICSFASALFTTVGALVPDQSSRHVAEFDETGTVPGRWDDNAIDNMQE